MTFPLVRRDGVVVGMTAIAVVLLYGRTLLFDYVNIDDPLYVDGKDIVQRGLSWEGVQYAFTSTSEGNYLPLTWLSYMLVAELAGADAAGQHAANVLLHAGCASLFYLFLRGATGATARSALAALVFALHPLRVESVAWVAERKDVLSGVFWMLALIAYLLYARRPSVWRYGCLLILFACGLLAKSMVVTLPCVLLLLDYWPLDRYRDETAHWSRRAAWFVAEKLPMFAMAGIASAMALSSQTAVGAVSNSEFWGPARRLMASAAAYVSYLIATFWPANLAVFYPMPVDGVDVWRAAIGSALLIAVSLVAVAHMRRRPYAIVGWLWFCGALVPVIGLVQVGGQSHADRYTYLPHAGLMIAFVWGASEWAASRGLPQRIRTLAAGLICLICASISWQQIQHWRDSESLFTHAIAVTDENWFAEGNLGVAYMDRGALGEAETHLRRATEIGPPRHGDYLNLGYLLKSMERPQEAQEALETAASIFDGNGPTWALLGEVRMEQGDLSGAISAFERSLELVPSDADSRINLAIAYGMGDRPAPARLNFETALRQRPDDGRALYNYAIMEIRLGRTAEGRVLLERLVRVVPRHAEARYSLAALDALQDRLADSGEHLRRAIALDPALANRWRGDPAFSKLRASGFEP